MLLPLQLASQFQGRHDPGRFIAVRRDVAGSGGVTTAVDHRPRLMRATDGSPLISPLVWPQWLAAHLQDPGLRILDARWLLGCRNGREFTADDRDGYRGGHIPGALFVGMQSELSDPHHPVPDMLAPPDQFARVMGRLRVGDDTLVITDKGFGLPARRVHTEVEFRESLERSLAEPGPGLIEVMLSRGGRSSSL